MAKHNFSTMGPLSKYNSDGEVAWASSEDDLARIKQAGFTREYVKSKYPTTAFNKKTGQSRPIGKLGDTDEQVAAKLAGMGPDWTFDHVPEPDPVSNKKAEDVPGADFQAILSIMADVALMKARVADLESAAIQSEEIRIALASRVGELEGLIEEPAPKIPSPAPTPAKSAVAPVREPIAPAGAGKK